MMLTSNFFRARKRIICLNGKKETSNAWYLQLLMALLMEQLKISLYTGQAIHWFNWYNLLAEFALLGRIMIMRHFTSWHRIWSVKIWFFFQQLNDIKARHIVLSSADIIQPGKSSIEICSIYKVIKISLVVVTYVTDSYCLHTMEYHLTFVTCAQTVERMMQWQMWLHRQGLRKIR